MTLLPEDSGEFYRALFELNPNPLFVFDLASLRILAVNEASVRQYGYARDEFLGITAADLRPVEERPRFIAKMKEIMENPPGVSHFGVWKHMRKDGTSFQVKITAAIVENQGRRYALTTAPDISGELAAEATRREQERQMLVGQKMEAISRLAGGVAHEFNNLLTGIMGLATLIEERAGLGSGVGSDASAIIAASKRAAGLVLRLLTFSRQKEPDKRLLDLNDILERNRQAAAALLGERVQLSIRPCADRLPVKVDAEQLDQVFVNLCLNARDALAHEGRVTLSTALVKLSEPLSLAQGALLAGRYAVFAVEDSGHGVSPEDRQRIFEPFFTTRGPGRGSGLGLSVAYAIAKEHDGIIDFESAPGRGSTFRLYLPLAASGAPAAAEPPAPPRAAQPARGRVMVADDEGIVREAIARVLGPAGYRVVTAANGEEAARLFAEADGFDLILLDVVMPKLDGLQAYERMKASGKPLPPVLFMSGYATARARDLIRGHGAQFLPKPFVPKDLIARVEKAITSKA